MRERDLETLHEIVDAAGGFGHREHLELAWTYLHSYSVDAAAEAMIAAIRHIARVHRAEGKYHETLTRAWLHFVAVHVQRWDGISFEEFLERNPALLERTLIHHFYSPALFRSEPARASWTPPDLRRLPALV